MCLTVNLNFTKNFREEHKGETWITCYKAVGIESEYNKDGTITLYVKAPYRHNKIPAGVYNSGLKKKPKLKDELKLSKGIHVCLTRQEAVDHDTAGVIPVLCRMRDLVAIGNNGDAIFTKVRVSPDDLTDILQEKISF